MTILNANAWQIAASAAALTVLLAVALWLVLRKRPTAEELERARRQFLVQSGRLVDGMLLDVCEVEATANSPGKSNPEAASILTMLMYSYQIGGVDYECAQDITALLGVVDAAEVRAGFPCTVRYQPGNPQNSIVVAENWTGMRASLPVLRSYDDPEPLDLSHLRPGRG
jgi:hypothetical protein